MFVKNEAFRAGMTATALLAAHIAQAQAQTLDEITELQKQRVVAELRAQVKTDAPAQPAVAAPAQPVVAREQIAPPPTVVSIFGVSQTLQAAITEESSRNVRVRTGDQTPSGWAVEKISPSAVTFVRAATGKAKATQPSSKSTTPAAAAVRRVTVAWGTTQSLVLADHRAPGSMPGPQMPMLAPNVAPYAGYMVNPAGTLQPVPAASPVRPVPATAGRP